jgi:gas vesicle protein
MDEHSEVIRKQMEETRSSLGEKLEALETQVTDTVQATTSAVSDTVEAVKDTVENVTESVKDTVQSVSESVSETFDFRGHVERHPWIVFGGSVLAGCMTAYLLTPSSSRKKEQRDTWASQPQREESAKTNGAYPPESQAGESLASSATSWLGGQSGWLGEQLNQLKGLALGTLMGTIRDMATQSLPDALGHRVGEEVDRFTTSMGAEPIHGSVLPEKQDDPESKQQTRGQQPAMASAQRP